MENIDKLLHNSKYKRLAKPLEAAAVCNASRELAGSRFQVLSFRGGLLTVGVKNSGEAANLQMELDQLKTEINQKLGGSQVQKIRIKIA